MSWPELAWIGGDDGSVNSRALAVAYDVAEMLAAPYGLNLVKIPSIGDLSEDVVLLWTTANNRRYGETVTVPVLHQESATSNFNKWWLNMYRAGLDMQSVLAPDDGEVRIVGHAFAELCIQASLEAEAPNMTIDERRKLEVLLRGGTRFVESGVLAGDAATAQAAINSIQVELRAPEPDRNFTDLVKMFHLPWPR